MAAAQVPTSALAIAGQPTISNYDVLEWNINGGGNVQSEDFEDAAGAFRGRVVYEKRMTRISGRLQWLAAGDGSEFPEGAMCTATGYTDYYVVSNRMVYTKGATISEVELEKVTLA